MQQRRNNIGDPYPWWAYVSPGNLIVYGSYDWLRNSQVPGAVVRNAAEGVANAAAVQLLLVAVAGYAAYKIFVD